MAIKIVMLVLFFAVMIGVGIYSRKTATAATIEVADLQPSEPPIRFFDSLWAAWQRPCRPPFSFRATKRAAASFSRDGPFGLRMNQYLRLRAASAFFLRFTLGFS